MSEFTQDKEKLVNGFCSHDQNGLASQQVEINRKQYGENAFTKEKPPSMAKRVLEAASEPMIIMLIMAAIIALAVNLMRYFSGGEADFLECAGIFTAIFLSVIITVVMEGRSAKAFEALNRINEELLVKVIRNGTTQMLPQNQLVVGDIVLLATGDKVTADGRLLDSTELYADESSLTGESVPVKKDCRAVLSSEKTPVAERINMVFSGCYITGGSGKMLVTGVGDNTEFGKIAGELSRTINGSTPLQEKLAKLGKLITILGSAAAGVVFLIQLFLYISNGTASLDNVSEAFITSIVLIVAAVPEGLPTIVAVSLSINIIKMSKQNALVKKMIACETVGCINVICSDKTGILTENRMTVTDVCDCGELVKPEALTNLLLLENFCVNSTADLGNHSQQTNFIGNPTEGALLMAARSSGKEYKEYRRNAEIIHVFSFSSETKNMTTVVKKGSVCLAYTKGSPEKIMEMCNISPEEKADAESQIEAFQAKACRVIGFAHREFAEESWCENRKKCRCGNRHGYNWN